MELVNEFLNNPELANVDKPGSPLNPRTLFGAYVGPNGGRPDFKTGAQGTPHGGAHNTQAGSSRR